MSIETQKKIEFPLCDICGSKSNTVVWNDLTSWEHEGIFRIVKCSICGLMYTSPRPIPSEIGKYYPVESYWGTDVRVSTKKNMFIERKRAYEQLFSYVDSYKKSGSILDIGAGTGMFLSYFKEKGWKTDGIELSKEAVSFAKKTFDITLKKGDFLDYHFPKNSLDVVVLNNALEHLYSPRKTLEEVYSCLKKGGIIIITVPNVNSIGLKLFGKNWHALQPPRHLYHFSPSTLSRLITQIGFTFTGENHWYFTHNFYTIFESFRFTISPRFKKNAKGGLVTAEYKKQFSLKKEVGKIFTRALSLGIVLLGSSLNKSEVFTIYATKK